MLRTCSRKYTPVLANVSSAAHFRSPCPRKKTLTVEINQNMVFQLYFQTGSNAHHALQ